MTSLLSALSSSISAEDNSIDIRGVLTSFPVRPNRGAAMDASSFFAFMYKHWKEIYKKNSISFKLLKNKYVLLSIIILVVPLFLWSYRSSQCCGSWIPGYGYQKQLSEGNGGAGFGYILDIFKNILYSLHKQDINRTKRHDLSRKDI